MICVVGLGNPGDKYQNTRHNFGFLALDGFVQTHLPEAKWSRDKKNETEIIHDNFAGQKMLLIKPQAFMNNSGGPIKSICQNEPLEPGGIWVIHDDIDLDLGMIRVRLGSSAAGHKGVQSVIDAIGTANFWRMRLGTGPIPDIDVSRYVTMPFDSAEQEIVNEVIKKTSDLLASAIEAGGLQESTYVVGHR